MRIAHILHGWPPEKMGGTGMYVQATAQAQADAGHPTAIVSPLPGKRTHQEHNTTAVEHWRVQTTEVRRWTDTWEGPLDGWRRWCDTWRPDVVHIHHLSGWPLGLIDATPCRTVLTLHDYAIPCARGQLIKEDLSACTGPEPRQCSQCLAPALRTHPALEIAAKLLRPFPQITSFARRAIGHTAGEADPRIQARLLAAKAALEAADVLLSPSDDLRERMNRMGYPNATLTALPLLRPAVTSSSVPPGPVRFLFASTIIPTKGPDRVIEAFLSLNEPASLTIAGHAPPFPSVPGYAKRLKDRVSGQPNIRWLGAVDSETIPSLMAEHDVLVLPSLWPENSPLVVREATATGLQVITSTAGGANELAPNAHCVESDADLLRVMNKLAQDGRMRHPPTRWPTPMEHAKMLLQSAYKGPRA